MICPKCMAQMHQKDKLGGGEAVEGLYTTWTIQECPSCGKLIKEYYEAKFISEKDLSKLSENQTGN